MGFYSLAPGALAYADTPELARRVWPGTMCLGFGSRALLQTSAGTVKVSAASSSPRPRAAAEVGGVVLIIVAKNDRAAQWYASYGAVPLSNKPLTLGMSLATFAAGLKAAVHL